MDEEGFEAGGLLLRLDYDHVLFVVAAWGGIWVQRVFKQTFREKFMFKILQIVFSKKQKVLQQQDR